MTARARTVFLGSGAFGLPAAEALAGHASVELVAVVTVPPRPVGRGRIERPTPIGRWATERRLPTLTPRRLRDGSAVDGVMALAPDLLVLADYGQLVPRPLLELPPRGALNLHPSLLPRHRGASPIPAAILAGDRETGVTLMLMDAGIDSGPIVAQRSLPLRGDEFAQQLEQQLAALAADVLSDSLDAWLAGRIVPRDQPEAGVTVTRPLRRDDGQLDPTAPAVQLERQVRAYQPWPGSYVELSGQRLIVWRARVVDTTPAHGVALQTADGILELLEVQPAGGRRMPAADFARGRVGRLALG